MKWKDRRRSDNVEDERGNEIEYSGKQIIKEIIAMPTGPKPLPVPPKFPKPSARPEYKAEKGDRIKHLPMKPYKKGKNP